VRIDVWLVENGKVSSRQKAQELIGEGRIYLIDAGGRRQLIKKSSFTVPETSDFQIQVTTTEGPEFVSRGGLKLLGALKRLPDFDVRGHTVLDLGISTGGFTDCLLQEGALNVVGVDVGHGQLAEKLRSDSRVILLEGLNAREASVEGSPVRNQILGANGGSRYSRIVIDVSFISLKMILPAAAALLDDLFTAALFTTALSTSAGGSGKILALVKPQFEVGREGLGKNGIVKDVKLYPQVEASIRDTCVALGLKVEDFFESPILGSDGNKEFFIYATNPQVGLF
jgi:23S rRNA (cytidine1920-2'-O)/16S rRNA (cytidine1409-2'-O)-methyltransferase